MQAHHHRSPRLRPRIYAAEEPQTIVTLKPIFRVCHAAWSSGVGRKLPRHAILAPLLPSPLLSLFEGQRARRWMLDDLS